MKIYCHNCKYFSAGFDMDFSYDECRSPKNTEVRSSPFRKYKVYRIAPDVRNKNNKCKLYKKAWWLSLFLISSHQWGK